MRLKRRGGDSGPSSLGHAQAEALHDVRVPQLGLAEALRARQLVQPIAAMAGGALHERVAERRDVARRDPHLGVHQDARVETHDVVALLDHGPPPGALDVVLELHAERPVVPHGVDAAVDLAAREDEAAPLGQRHDGLERGDRGPRVDARVRQGRRGAGAARQVVVMAWGLLGCAGGGRAGRGARMVARSRGSPAGRQRPGSGCDAASERRRCMQ